MNLEHTLAKLISFRTVTGDRLPVDALYDWVKDSLQPVPLYIRTYEYNGLPSLVITPTRRKRARIWLAAHVDVVGGPDTLFQAERTGAHLVGRGAIDMKFAVACYLRLLTELGVRIREYDIAVMLTPDEEWGRTSSVQHLLEHEGYTGDVAFLPDGSGWWKFEESAKGIWGLAVETTGVAAHGSKPWLGHSATHELMAYLTEAHQLSEGMFDPSDPEHWYTTLNVGELSGGTAYNMVAPHAKATVDVRYVRPGDKRKIERMFDRLSKKYPHTTYRVIIDEQPYGILRRNGYIKEFSRIARERYGIECAWVRAHGSSDARYFNAANIPTILIGPHGGGSHSDKEWIDVEDMERYYEVLKEFVETIGRK